MADVTPVATKPWYLSKTMIVNMILLVVSGLAIAFPQLAGIGDFIKANGATLGVVVTIINIVLRYVTKTGIQIGD